MQNIKRTVGIPIFIILILGLLYLFTMPRGLTWAFDGADGGDLVTAVVTGGVPHPTGYPTYLLLSKAFFWLPVGSMATRGNLFSVVCTLLSSVLLFSIIQQSSSKWWTGFLGAVIFGTLPLVWSQGIITEVYALQTLLSLFLIYLVLREKKDPYIAGLEGLVLGLLLGNHRTAIFLLPLIFLPTNKGECTTGRKITPGCLRDYAATIAGLTGGLLVYLLLPLRATQQSPVVWGDPATWEGFWWLVSGRMYAGRLILQSSGYYISGLMDWSDYILGQLTVAGVLLAVICLVFCRQKSRVQQIMQWITIIYSGFAVFYWSDDAYVYLMLPLAAASTWAALGLEYITGKIGGKVPGARVIPIILAVILISARVAAIYPRMDIHSDTTAEDSARQVLVSALADSILLTTGDEMLFSLWYTHYVNGMRPDVVVVSRELLEYEWYRDRLMLIESVSLPPAGNIADIRLFNPGRSVCAVDRISEVILECDGD